MKICVLSSGSKGNTTYIESEKVKILIDIGNSAKYVKEKLEDIGVEPEEINAVLITHTHVDHVKGLKVFENKYNIPVYITDTGYINKKYFDILSNRNVYVMESNHDIEMLNNGSYPFNLRQRILSDKGHLSNYDSAKYLSSFIGNNTKCIILAHLSEDNNTEELAYNTLIERLNDSDTHVDNIIIAKQNEETELVKL